jgi:hypothetical protein
MADQQEKKQKQRSEVKFPAVPKSMEKRVSMKWLTLQALQHVQKRLQSGPRVVLLTAWGQVEGDLCEIEASYAESFTRGADRESLRPDVASMVTHLRSEILAMFEQEEQELHLVDAAPILSLRDVVLKSGSVESRLPQMTLFADQVIGFAPSHVPELH